MTHGVEGVAMSAMMGDVRSNPNKGSLDVDKEGVPICVGGYTLDVSPDDAIPSQKKVEESLSPTVKPSP